jgi:hypothetical protein
MTVNEWVDVFETCGEDELIAAQVMATLAGYTARRFPGPIKDDRVNLANALRAYRMFKEAT